LKLHPNSAYAYGYLATIADREGKTAEAAEHRQRAEQLSTKGLDELQRKYRTR